MRVRDIKIRNTWGIIKPATKIIQSKRINKTIEEEMINMQCVYEVTIQCTRNLDCAGECFEGDTNEKSNNNGRITNVWKIPLGKKQRARRNNTKCRFNPNNANR